MTDILFYAFVYLAAAVVAVLVCQRLNLGSVLGYLVAGIALGPILGVVGTEASSIQHFAEFGVVMMLFLVGLELAPQMLWKMRHKLLGLGGLQVLLSLCAIAGIAMLCGQSWQVGVAIGCILALSSTAIVLQTFNEKGLMASAGGQAGFSVLLFQDVAAIPMLALLPLLGMSNSQIHNQHGSHLLANQPAWVHTVVTIGALIIIIFSVRHILPPIFRLIARTRLHEMFTLCTLALVVGIAALMSAIGLSPALGAFIAGVGLANNEYRHELESQLEPFKGLLLGLFFITVGAGMNFVLLYHEFFLIASLTIGTMLIKAAVLFALSKIFRLSALDGKLFALSLAQAGEFGFVLLSISTQNDVLSSALADRILLVVALSMVLTPLLFILYDRVIVPRALRKGKNSEQREADDIHESNPIILLGHGRFGQQVNSILMACGFKTTVIDYHADTIELLAHFGIQTYYGDATRPELLQSAGIAKAKLLIIAIDDRQQSLFLVEYVHRHYPDLPIIVRAYDRHHTFDLYAEGAQHIIRETFDSAVRCGRKALEQLGITPEKADEICQQYYRSDRHTLKLMAEAYDPNVPLKNNEKMAEIYKREEADAVRAIQELLNAETANQTK